MPRSTAHRGRWTPPSWNAFATDGLRVVELERLPHADPTLRLWRVHLTR